MSTDELHTPSIEHDFSDIAPYDDHQFHEKIAKLVNEPGFEHAVRYVMPDVDYKAFTDMLLTVKNRDDFQVKVMGPFLEMLVSTTTAGLSVSGLENYTPGRAFTFITNHRDIVLDASFLNLCFIRNRMPITEVAIGNNLLIYDWITDLVKLNRSFIVKRGEKVTKALEAAKHLSAYIHYAIGTKHESVWIAQREGRAKDSNDRTQESLIKMLAFGPADTRKNILDVNLLPVSISYEYDPNDYLKVREFLLRRRDPDFKKSQRDDLFSMETGILKQKGRVHFALGRCINPDIEKFDSDNRAEIIHHTCSLIDRSIHCGYHIYPGNYIAFDELNGTNTYTDKYTADDIRTFDEYIAGQLAKVDEDGISGDEQLFMRRMMLTMYANPLQNQREVSDCSGI